LNTRKLGSTDVEVTELGFGAAQIGNLYAPVDDETVAAAVDAAWQEGVRYFDTAPHYGLGLSERRLGAALGKQRAPRPCPPRRHARGKCKRRRHGRNQRATERWRAVPIPR
jgi:diketogulonate reductase-like aldo/keto reductase